MKSDNPKSRGIRAAPLFPRKRLFCCLDEAGDLGEQGLLRSRAPGSGRFPQAQMTGNPGSVKGIIVTLAVGTAYLKIFSDLV